MSIRMNESWLSHLRSVKDRLRNSRAMKSRLVKGASWMMLSEFMARLSRIVTLLVFAALFTPVDYGTAMLALVCHELIRVFSRLGIGAKVIQCSDQELDDYAGNAKTLQWIVCIGLTLLQLSISGLIAAFYDNSHLVMMLDVMAFSHLIYPLVTVRVFLLQRLGNMRYFGIASGISIAVDNLSAALMLILGLGLMSVAYAKILAAAVWVIMFSFAKTQPIRARFCQIFMPKLVSFSGRVLLSELLKVGRLHIDVLLAGRILSPELFGLYSFAKSSGVGLSQSISSGFITSLYPYISEAKRNSRLVDELPHVMKVVAMISGIFLLQALLAPVYINLLFAEQWQVAIPMVSILCLSAIALLILDVANMLLRVSNHVNWEIYQSLLCMLIMTLMIVLIQPVSALVLASLVTFVSFLWLPVIYCIMTMHFKTGTAIAKTSVS